MGTAKTVSGTKVEGPEGLYKAKVQVKDENGKWVDKSGNDGYSTFFPDEWDQTSAMEEIKHAKSAAKKIPGTTNTYKGYSVDGKIEIHM